MSVDFHVLTGAPGTGKTSILDLLSREVSVVPEPARRVLARWRSQGNPQPAKLDTDILVRRITELTAEDHATAQGVVVFDRGAIDCLAYARYLDCDPVFPASAARSLPFGGSTFLTTPWPEIYSTDDERTMSFEQVVRFHDVLMSTYEEFGVEMVTVPKAPVEDRAAFILDRIV